MKLFTTILIFLLFLPSLSFGDTITSKNLCKEFQNNKIRANIKYKNKIFEIIGIIEKIDTSIFGENIQIRLACPGLQSVLVDLDFKWEKSVAAVLNTGDKIKVTGEILGSGLFDIVTVTNVINVEKY